VEAEEQVEDDQSRDVELVSLVVVGCCCFFWLVLWVGAPEWGVGFAGAKRLGRVRELLFLFASTWHRMLVASVFGLQGPMDGAAGRI
jgi:hypothetical protein